MSVVLHLENHRSRSKSEDEFRAVLNSHVDAIRTLTTRYRAEAQDVDRIGEWLEDAANDLLDVGEGRHFDIALRRLED